MLFATFVLLILHHSGLTDASCPPESGESLPNAMHTLLILFPTFDTYLCVAKLNRNIFDAQWSLC